MRKIKFYTLIMSILSCVILCSIGFSSWYNFPGGKPPSTNYSGGAYEAYAVTEKTEEGISIDFNSMKVFQFSGLSFKTPHVPNSSNSFQNSPTGTIEVTYTVDGSTIPEGGQFKIIAELGYSDANINNLFETAFAVADNGYTVHINGNKLESTSIQSDTESNDKIIFTYNVTNAVQNENYTVTILYTFTIPSSTTADPLNFRNSFGKNIKGSDGTSPTKFITKVSTEQIKG